MLGIVIDFYLKGFDCEYEFDKINFISLSTLHIYYIKILKIFQILFDSSCF